MDYMSMSDKVDHEGFHNNGYSVVRDKELGEVYVYIKDGAISTQRADSLARGMFAHPVRLMAKGDNLSDPNVGYRMTARFYFVPGYNG